MRPILVLLTAAFFFSPLELRGQSPEDSVRGHSEKAHRDLDREAGRNVEGKEELPAPKTAATPKPAVKPEPAVEPETLEAPAPKKEAAKVDPGTPVTLYWHMADDADVYLNGKPLREYSPSFRTRGDEAPRPAFSTSAVIRNGDVFTVGGRRGGSYGFMLIAVDASDRVVFKTDSKAWKVYDPADSPNWFLPSASALSPTREVSVQTDPWYPQKELNGKYGNKASSIWGTPGETFSHLYGVVTLEPPAPTAD